MTGFSLLSLADTIFCGWLTKADNHNLDYRERAIVSEHLGFCPECFSDYQLVTDESGRKIKQHIKPKAFIDIAYDHGLSSPSSADRIYRKALEKMRKAIREKIGT